jgi:hypothetical protein
VFRDFPIKSGFRVKQMKERFDSETNVEFIRFLRYARLKKPARHPAGGYEERKPTNREPDNLSSYTHLML